MVVNDEHIAAAVAAAAELAKTGGAFIFASEMLKQGSGQQGLTFPMTVPQSPQRSFPEASDEESEGKDEEDNAERRIARSRERNREHARRTRLRKKAQLEALQSKVKGLQAESKVLKQSLEECSIASILVGLSTGSQEAMFQPLLNKVAATEDQEILKIVGGKRKRFVSLCESPSEKQTQPLKIMIDGKLTVIGGGRTHINWKTGVYSDENGASRQLSQEQLESLRRERNRMHAKMTRDRKKNFIATIEKTITELETNNQRMKDALSVVIQNHFKDKASAATVCSPESGSATPRQEVPPLYSEKEEFLPMRKRARSSFGI